MIESQKISARQLFFVIWAAAYGGGVYNNALAIGLAGRDILFAPLIGGIILTLMCLMIWYISKSFPGQSIFQVLEKHAGGIVGKVFAVSNIFISIALVVLLLRLISGLVGAFILPHTPRWFPTLAILLISLYVLSKGLEVQARMFVVVMPVVLSLWFVGTYIGLLNQFDFSNLLPVFDSSPSHFIGGTYLFIAPLCEPALALLLFAAALRNPSQGLGPIIKGLTLAVVIIPIGVVAIMIGILGVEQASRIGYQGINITLSVGVGDFIQGVEVFLLATYEIIAISKIVIHTYCAWMTASHLLKDRLRWTIFSTIGIITFIATMSISSFNQAFFYYTILSQYVVFPFMALTILLTLILVVIGKRRKHYLNQD